MSTITLFAPEETAPPTIAPAVVPKQIIWPTNYNNKLGCTGFIHIDLAPKKMPLRSVAETIVFEISTADGSHAPERYRMVNMMKLEVNQVREAYTLASHGMTQEQFAEWIFDKYSADVLGVQFLALYYYLRDNQ